MALSAKAQGKQRAVDSRADNDSSSLNIASRINIRFSDGSSDLSIPLTFTLTIGQIKAFIIDEKSDLAQRRLKLIHSGQILPNDTLLYQWAANKKLLNNSPSNSHSSNSEKENIIWLHCAVGNTTDQAGEEEEHLQAGQLKPATGFDRLTAIGFSEEDIINFRQQFHSQSRSDFIDDENFESEEQYVEHARSLEEQWIDSPDNVVVSIYHPRDSSLIQGILMGFFFPLIPLFFMSKDRPPVFWDNGVDFDAPDNTVFPQSVQVGLVIGFIANLAFGMWRVLLENT